MNPLKTIPISEAVRTWKAVVDAPLKLIFCVLLDAVFFLMFGLITSPIFTKLTEHVLIIGGLVSDVLKASGRSYVNNKSLIEILGAPDIWPFVSKFFFLLVLLGVIVYFLYCFFQGVVWKISSEMAGYNIDWLEFLKTFTKTNILWFAFFIVYYFGGLFAGIRATILMRVNPAYIPGLFFRTFFAIILVIVIYFMIISYVSGGIRIGFRAGVAGWKEFAPAMILLIASFLVIDYVMLKVSMINLQFYYLMGIVLFLPAMTFTKVYIFRITRRIAENGILPQH